MNNLDALRVLRRFFQGSSLALGVSILLLPSAPAAEPAPAEAKDPETLWQQIESLKKANALPPPGSIRTNKEAFAAWRQTRGSNTLALADLNQRFYTTYPADPRSASAKRGELDALRNPNVSGLSNAVARLQKAEQNFLSDTNATLDERFRIRQSNLDRKLSPLLTSNRKEYSTQYRAGIKELVKEFPTKQETLQLSLLRAADQVESLDGLAIAREIFNSSTGRLHQASERVLKRLDRVGKPLDLTLTNLSGGTFSVSALKGKVILLEFGASWSSPWKRDVPQLKKAYDDFHAQGLEIFGISLDNDPKNIEKFKKDEKIPWDFFCDGKAYRSETIQNLNLGGIPSRWLIDRKGLLREMNARNDLTRMITELIAEKP